METKEDITESANPSDSAALLIPGSQQLTTESGIYKTCVSLCVCAGVRVLMTSQPINVSQPLCMVLE